MFRIVANHKINKKYYSILQRNMITAITENIIIDDHKGTLVSFSKKEYINTVSDKRSTFMMKHFAEELKKVFTDLKIMANKMLPCEYTVCLTIKEHFDRIKVQNIVISYFNDLGYEVTTIDVLILTDICIVLK